MDKLYIIVPAYNEADNIENLIEDWYPIVEKYHGDGQSRLVIINDGSKDNTYEIVSKCAKTRPMLVPLTKVNGGHGATVLHGYRYAVKNDADYIFQTDADGQTNPDEFHAFWEQRKDFDAIIGARPDRQDGAGRKFVEKVLLKILKLVFGVELPDANAPFRLMKTELVEKYILKMPSDFNLPNVMLTTYFAYYHEKLKFIDVSFKPRQAGTNSINVKRIVAIGIKAVGDFWNLKKNL